MWASSRNALDRLVLVVFVGCVGWGCATSRGTLELDIPTVPDPAGSKTVAITRVADLRKFEHKPTQPSIPSLKDGQITDETITSRAIARKRNGYGMALGDILLPEGQTVDQVVRETLVKALREKGYSVLAAGAAAGADTLPLEAEILQYWAWITPGFWAARLEFESILRIESPILVDPEQNEVRGYVRLSTQAATGRAWRNTILKGTDDLIAKLMEAILNPAQLEIGSIQSGRVRSVDREGAPGGSNGLDGEVPSGDVSE